MENTKKKKIVVFSGAGLDRESGILTFRDCKDGLWNNYKIDEVATPQGWAKDRSKVLDFYNERRRELPNVEPNEAHRLLVELEKDFEVTHVTQNVSDLLQRAGASTVYNLHGELTKARTSFAMNNPMVVMSQPVIDIEYKDINLGDVDEDGVQLRPHIVWFGEYPFHIDKSYKAFDNADIVLIIGTSLQIGYTLSFFDNLKSTTKVFYVDPYPAPYLDGHDFKLEYVKKSATEGIQEVIKKITE
jgi:NAD-dependent deacetylase